MKVFAETPEVETDQRIVRIYRVVLKIENGISSKEYVETAWIRTAGWEVKDIKFIDDEEVVLAVSETGRLFLKLV